jgi:hypothetical protein
MCADESCGAGQGTVEGCCELGNEIVGFMYYCEKVAVPISRTTTGFSRMTRVRVCKYLTSAITALQLRFLNSASTNFVQNIL